MQDQVADHPTDDELHAFSLGEVDAAELERVAAHVNECAHCCETINHLVGRDALLVQLRSAVAPENSRREDSDRESAVRALRRGQWRDALPPRPPELAMVPDPPLDSGEPPVWQVAAYDVIGEVGRGGMGVVYKARHRGLNRLVALKMVLAGEFASQLQRLRFQREAELAARVKHVNIVQIHEVGNLDDRPYLSMEWIDGGTLADRLDGRPWPSHQAAKLVGALARAIEAAHRQGVIHRDLKPSNILMQTSEGVDQNGNASGPDNDGRLAGLVPKITDFGLARTVEGEAGLTKTGFAVGTPEYMAPEQASGEPKLVGPTVDVYALGVILYQLITGRVPFGGDSPAAVLYASASATAISPRRLDARIPRDLETIALKAIDKEPALRYSTALAMSEDLRRFLAGEPILARPPSPWERMVKWARRERGLAALAASLVLITVGAFTGLTSLWLAAERANDRAQQNSKAERRARYRADISAAASALRLDYTETAHRLLQSTPGEYRNWEWRYLLSQLDNSQAAFQPPEGPPRRVCFSPDCGRVLYTIGTESVIHLWDVRGQRKIAALQGHEGEILVIAFSPDGSRIVSSAADRTVRVWDGATGRPLTVLRGHTRHIDSMAFSDDGARVSSYSRKQEVRVWDLARGVLLSVLGGQNEPKQLKLNGNGTRLAAAEVGRIRLWDVDAGVELPPINCGKSQVVVVAFSPDGTRLLAGTDYPQNRVMLWDVATRQLMATLDGHQNAVRWVGFNPDGRLIASASLDQTLRLWDSATGQSIATLIGHEDFVTAASFHPDGRRLVSTSDNGSLRLWDTATRQFAGTFRGQRGTEEIALSKPDGSILASVGRDGVIHFWDVERVNSEGVLGRHTSFVYDVAFSPTGQTVASAGWDGKVRLWDVRTGRQSGQFQHSQDIVTALAFRSDGRRLASMDRDNRLHIWDQHSSTRLADLETSSPRVIDPHVAFAAQGDMAASTGGDGGSVRLYNPGAGVPYVDLRHLGGAVNDVTFSSDGSRLVAAHEDGMVRVWNVARRSLERSWRDHNGGIIRVAISSDGRRIATNSTDKTVRIWDTATWANLAALKHNGAVFATDFSPDGTRLAAACSDNTVRLWDMETFDEVTVLRGHTAYVHAVSFSPDGTMLVSGSGDFTVRLWDSRPAKSRQDAPDETVEK